jgi:hypothetical protein
MSRKRFLNDAEQAVLIDVCSNLGVVGQLMEEYRNHTHCSVRSVRALVLDIEEELARLAKGNYRHGRNGEEAQSV